MSCDGVMVMAVSGGELRGAALMVAALRSPACAWRIMHTSAFDAYSTFIFSVTECAPTTLELATGMYLVTEHGDPNCSSKT